MANIELDGADDCQCETFYPDQCPSCLSKSQDMGIADTKDEAGGSLKDFPLKEKKESGEDDEDEGMVCSSCGGYLAELGNLGNKTWYRCRNCGMEESR